MLYIDIWRGFLLVTVHRQWCRSEVPEWREVGGAGGATHDADVDFVAG